MLNVREFKFKLIVMHLNARFACCHSLQCIQDNPLSFTPRHFVTTSERALSSVCRWYYDDFIQKMHIFKEQCRKRLLLVVFEAWGREAQVLPPPLIDSDVEQYFVDDFEIIPVYWDLGLTFVLHADAFNLP